MRTLPSGRKWKLHEYGSHWILWLWTLLLSLLLLIVYNIPDFWLKKAMLSMRLKTELLTGYKNVTFVTHCEEPSPFFKRFNLLLQNFLLFNLQHLLNNSQLLGIVMMIRDRANFEKHFIMVGFPVASYNVKAALM